MIKKRTIHLRWVGVDDPDILCPVRPLKQNLLHVAAEGGHHRTARQLRVDETEKFSDVSHKFLADALARTVDGQLQGRGGVEHCCSKHGDADGLAKPVTEKVIELKKSVPCHLCMP